MLLVTGNVQLIHVVQLIRCESSEKSEKLNSKSNNNSLLDIVAVYEVNAMFRVLIHLSNTWLVVANKEKLFAFYYNMIVCSISWCLQRSNRILSLE